MRPEGVAAASREVRRSARAHRRIALAETLEEAEDAWIDFLTHAGKVYTKLRAACHGQPLDWSWWKKKMDERRDDLLLAYVHHARNCDTHRLEPMTAQIPDGQHLFDVSGMEKVQHRGPAHLRPLPVTDKGVTYDPPIRHKNIGLAYADVGMIAFLAGLYLQELVSEAESRPR